MSALDRVMPMAWLDWQIARQDRRIARLDRRIARLNARIEAAAATGTAEPGGAAPEEVVNERT